MVVTASAEVLGAERSVMNSSQSAYQVLPARLSPPEAEAALKLQSWAICPESFSKLQVLRLSSTLLGS